MSSGSSSPEPRQGPAPCACWGYERDNGPEVWGRLDPAWATCDSGAEQSPVDLSGGATQGVSPVEFDYGACRATVENTGHSIQVNPSPGPGMELDGVRFDLRQFHFHHGAEHTVAGVQLPLELHLVHLSDAGGLAVVGVLIREGAVNAALSKIWACLPEQVGPPTDVPGVVDLPTLLPDDRTSWRYRGSLTTPPCTEGVAWIVIKQPLTMSAGQIAAFAQLYPNNFRPVQPLGSRVLRFG